LGFASECRSKREMPSLYPHAKGILYALKDKGVDLAIASRSPTADIAKTFLDKLSIKSIFVAQVSQEKQCFLPLNESFYVFLLPF
jgi:magnesium-dependent phosphatase 1